jgi:molecular chaperone GrpE
MTEEEKNTQAEEYLAGWKRALADYENLQKENASLREDDRRRIRVNLAHDLLPVIDNFDQALKFAPKDVDKNWFAGVQHIARQFADALKGLGIEPIEAVGHAFDPNRHESGGSRWEEDKPEQVILEEVIKGWKLGDLVIRPSKVIVNQK